MWGEGGGQTGDVARLCSQTCWCLSCYCSECCWRFAYGRMPNGGSYRDGGMRSLNAVTKRFCPWHRLIKEFGYHLAFKRWNDTFTGAQLGPL